MTQWLSMGRKCHHHGHSNSHEEGQENKQETTYALPLQTFDKVSGITGHVSAENATIFKPTGDGSSHRHSVQHKLHIPSPYTVLIPWELSMSEVSWDGRWHQRNTTPGSMQLLKMLWVLWQVDREAKFQGTQ